MQGEPAKPISGGVLSPDVRMCDLAHPGVVAAGDGWRIAVTLDGRFYRVQTPVEYPDGSGWQSLPGRAGVLCKQVERVADRVPDLRDAAARLPDDPADAAPDFVAAARELRRLYDVTEHSRSEYAGEVARAGNWRLIVASAREYYVAQRVNVFDVERNAELRDVIGDEPPHVWEYVAAAKTLGRLDDATRSAPVDQLSDRVERWRECEDNRTSLFVQAAKIAPERAADGDWSWLPQRPEGRRAMAPEKAPESR